MSEPPIQPDAPPPAGEPSQPTADGPSGIEADKDSRTWGMIAHLSALSGYLIPFGNIIGPLVVWQIKKAEMPFVDYHGKEALNFNITYTLALIVGALSLFVCIGIFLLPAIVIVGIVFMIIAAMKANAGEYYRYPMIIRFIK